MKFHTVETLGPKQSLTGDGYLICQDVPIARIGKMVYGPGEVPVEAGPDGLVHIERYPEEVFREETIASFTGKPVTMDHPSDFVGPENWATLSKGITMNVRRGEGLDSDLLLADLMITDKQAIADVRAGLREVSCGYDADYEQIEPGRGAQRNIVGNHVALVERGRCGPRCAIGDKKPMGTKQSFYDRFMALMKDAETEKEETEAEKEAREKREREEAEAAEKAKTGDTLSAILTKLTTMDADIKALKAGKAKDEEGESEEERKKREEREKETKDEGDLTEAEKAELLDDSEVLIYTGDSARRDIAARAEILSPGIKLPTMDGKASTKDAALQLCSCQRRALQAAYNTADGKQVIDMLLGGQSPDFAKMRPGQLNPVFNGAAEMIRAKNTPGGTFDASKVKVGSNTGTADSIRNYSKKADAMWASATAKAH